MTEFFEECTQYVTELLESKVPSLEAFGALLSEICTTLQRVDTALKYHEDKDDIHRSIHSQLHIKLGKLVDDIGTDERRSLLKALECFDKYLLEILASSLPRHKSLEYGHFSDAHARKLQEDFHLYSQYETRRKVAPSRPLTSSFPRVKDNRWNILHNRSVVLKIKDNTSSDRLSQLIQICAKDLYSTKAIIELPVLATLFYQVASIICSIETWCKVQNRLGYMYSTSQTVAAVLRYAEWLHVNLSVAVDACDQGIIQALENPTNQLIGIKLSGNRSFLFEFGVNNQDIGQDPPGPVLDRIYNLQEPEGQLFFYSPQESASHFEHSICIRLDNCAISPLKNNILAQYEMFPRYIDIDGITEPKWLIDLTSLDQISNSSITFEDFGSLGDFQRCIALITPISNYLSINIIAMKFTVDPFLITEPKRTKIEGFGMLQLWRQEVSDKHAPRGPSVALLSGQPGEHLTVSCFEWAKHSQTKSKTCDCLQESIPICLHITIANVFHRPQVHFCKKGCQPTTLLEKDKYDWIQIKFPTLERKTHFERKLVQEVGKWESRLRNYNGRLFRELQRPGGR